MPNYDKAPPSYALSDDDIRAACPYSTNKKTGQPRQSDRLYYIDLNIETFSKHFVKPMKTWKYQTKNFGTFVAKDTKGKFEPII